VSANANDVTDDIDAALQARAAQGSTDSGGDDIDAALRARAKQQPTPPSKSRVGWAEENLAGPSEVIASTVANIPHAAAHGVVDLYRSIFSPSDVGKPDPAGVSALEVPMGAGGKQLLSDAGAMLPNRNNLPNQPDDTSIPEFGDTTQNIIGHGLRVGGDVGNIAAAAAPVKSILTKVPELTATGAPVAKTAEQVAAEAAAKQSGGAAGAPVDLSKTSVPLKAEIAKIDPKNVNSAALSNQVKADEFDIQLTKGEATENGNQLADEFNTRNQNPEFAERKAQTNTKLIKGLNDIKEDVAPAAAVDHETNAQTVIDAYKDKYAPIAADAKAKWEKFQEAAGGALPIEPGDFTATVSDALKKSGKTRYLPSEVAGDLKDLDNGEPFTVERWDNLKTNLAGAQRTAERTGNGNAALAVGAARDAVENYNFPNLDPSLQAMNKEARAATAKKYAMLKADPAMDTAVNDGIPRGQLSPEAKGYMERYFLKGNQADLANAQKNLAGSQDAKGAIAGSVTNELKKSAGIDLYRNDGNFSQSGYNTRLNELQPRIKYLMDNDAADKAFRLGDVARLAQRQPTGPAFNNSGTSVAAHIAQRVGSGVASLAETGANMATGKLKLGTGVREEAAKFAERKWVRDSLKPGAGISNE
jgi:hypothetical protein